MVKSYYSLTEPLILIKYLMKNTINVLYSDFEEHFNLTRYTYQQQIENDIQI